MSTPAPRPVRPVSRLAAAALVLAGLFGMAAPASAAGLRAEPAIADLDLSAGPVAGAHAHNDYLHERPLVDALEHGFTSIEADVFLADGSLPVAHTALGIRPRRTLRTLYLDPLADLVTRHARETGRASVWPGDATRLQLLVDLKTAGVATWREIERELATYPEGVFTRVVDGRVVHGAVDVVLSGGRPAEEMLRARDGHTLVDGHPGDLGRGIPADRMPMISESFARFAWLGLAPMPEARRRELCGLTRRALAGGHTMRFWGTPDTPGARERVWATERACGVTWLNSDDLDGLSTWLRARR